MFALNCIAVLALTAAPGTGPIAGTVLDAYSRLPVPYAEVSLPEPGISVLTDSLGRFAIPLGADDPMVLTIEASHVGYARRRWSAARAGRDLRLFLSPRPINLRGVTVTAFRSPVAVERSGPTTVVSRADLAERGAVTLAEALAFTPSMVLKDYGNLATIGLRGATSEQTLVLLDGVRLGTAQDNLVEPTSLPQTIADRVEVVRGGTSALYGANSVGGVVNVVTPMPDSTASAVTAGLGSLGARFLRLRHSSSNGSLGCYIGANLDRNANRFSWQDSLGIQRARVNADIAGSGIFAKAALNAEPHSGALSVSYSAGERGVPGPVWLLSESARMNDVRGLARFQYGWQQSDAGRLDASLYLHRFWRNYANPDPAFPQNDTHATTVSGASASERWAPASWCTALLAPELSHEQLASTSIGRPSRLSAGAVGQLELRWRGSSLAAALRYDEFHESRLDSTSGTFRRVHRATSPRLWVGYEATGWASAYASVNRSFRAPTFNELYWPEDPWSGGNARLAPERGVGLDVGVAGRPLSWLRYRVAGFRTSLTDLILWQADSAGVWRPANVDRATTTGAEIELETRTRHAGVRPNLAYLVARSNGRDLPYRPHLTVSVEHWLSWRWVRLGWNVRYTGSRFADAANSDTLPAYLLFDVGLDLSQRIGPVTADLRGGVRNLFDRRYQAVRDYPTPGRSFYSELELRI